MHSISFGLGFFLAGLYWIYISLNIYGQMPSFLAALSTFLFCLFLSFFFIPLCSLKYRFSILFLPALFTIIEWIRSFIFTGFPWLSYGYSQIYDSPLSGYFPIIGVHGVTFLMIGTTQRVLIDQSSKRKEGVYLGKTDNNRVVEIQGGPELLNKFITIKITNITEKNLEGVVLK